MIHAGPTGPAAILTAAFMLLGVMAVPASAGPADATVEGAVMNSNWDSLSGVTVEFFDEDVYANPEAAPISSVMTSGGAFSAEIPANDSEFSPVWLRLSKSGYETEVFGPYDVLGGDWTYLDTFWLNDDVTAYGTLTGVVTDASGSPLPNGRAYVTNFEDGDPEGDYWDYYVREIQANVSGNWSAQLPHGQYRVNAFDDWGDLRSAWAGPGATSYATAAVQTVTTGVTTTVPQMRLTDGARISGKVTDSQGSPIKGVSVAAFNGEDDDIEWATTNSRGEYALSGLDAGTLRLQFSDYIGDYATTWYVNGTSYATATDVTVTEGQASTGNNVVLADSNDTPPDHRVSGKVVDRTGKGQRGAYVTAYRKVGSDWEWWDSTSVRKTGFVRLHRTACRTVRVPGHQ